MTTIECRSSKLAGVKIKDVRICRRHFLFWHEDDCFQSTVRTKHGCIFRRRVKLVGVEFNIAAAMLTGAGHIIRCYQGVWWIHIFTFPHYQTKCPSQVISKNHSVLFPTFGMFLPIAAPAATFSANPSQTNKRYEKHDGNADIHSTCREVLPTTTPVGARSAISSAAKVHDAMNRPAPARRPTPSPHA